MAHMLLFLSYNMENMTTIQYINNILSHIIWMYFENENSKYFWIQIHSGTSMRQWVDARCRALDELAAHSSQCQTLQYRYHIIYIYIYILLWIYNPPTPQSIGVWEWPQNPSKSIILQNPSKTCKTLILKLESFLRGTRKGLSAA